METAILLEEQKGLWIDGGLLQQAQQEALALYGNQAPPVDQPYFGGVTWQTYRQLSDEARTALWDQMYQEFDIAIDDVEEKDVHPDLN